MFEILSNRLERECGKYECDNGEPGIDHPEDRRASQQKVPDGAAAKGINESYGDRTNDVHFVLPRFKRARYGRCADGDVSEEEEDVVHWIN